MKAIVYSVYGSPDVLRCEDVPKPSVADGQVLLRVRAASVNPLDWHFLRGTPYFLRLMLGARRPKSQRLGVDVAGQVEAVGRGVTRFQPGDAVFGATRGAFAEFVCSAESDFVHKPPNVTFEQAAAAPIAGLTALQALRNRGKLQQGQSVLVNGAAGGVGTFAVQIAKSFGAKVTAVCSSRNLDLVRSLGADRVIDYTRDDFTLDSQRFDVILDLIANHPLLAMRRLLNPGGVSIGAGGSPDGSILFFVARGLAGSALSAISSRKLVGFLAKSNPADLAALTDLMAGGRIKPVIDRCYPLEETPDAIRYLELGHARGKVVISLR